MNIVPQEHWDTGYKDFTIVKAPENDPITLLLKKYIPQATDAKHAFEIGCFPGRFLCVLGDLGYILNGVDTTPAMHKFEASLKALGYKTNKFKNKSYNEIDEEKYDVVASFGFIEHFTDWEIVIKAHTNFLADKGYIVITTPNFKGPLQYFYHAVLDRANLKRHVIESMAPEKWKIIIEQSGLQIISYGYIGQGFWDESNNYTLPFRIARKVAGIVFKTLQYIKPYHSSIASYCYIVAKRS